MIGIDRYSIEMRLVLDFVSFLLFTLELPYGTPIQVFGSEELCDDLQNRLSGHFTVIPSAEIGPSLVQVHLLEFNQQSLPHLAQHSGHVIVAFENALSHKSLLYPGHLRLNFVQLEAEMRRSFAIVEGIGIMAPSRVVWLLVAALANRLGRYDWGFFFADQALLFPIHRRWSRYFCSIGVVLGRSGLQ